MTKRVSQPAVEFVPVAVGPMVAADVAVAAEAEAAPNAESPAVETPAGIAMIEPAAPVAVQDMTTSTTTTQQDTMTSPATGEMSTTTVQETTTTTDDYSEDTDYTPFIVGGVLLAGGILAVALSGGDDDDDEDDVDTPDPEPANTAPTFTSGTTATVAENAATTTVVYDAAATDAESNAITYSLGGTDAALFTIDPATGEVRLNASANFEEGASYSFTVTATDNGSPAQAATVTVAVTVTDVNEAPTFATATASVEVDENLAAGTVVYTAAATDVDAEDTLTYSLEGEDADAFAIDGETGEVTFVGSPDFETQRSYTVNVVATDGGEPGLTATQILTVFVNDVDEVIRVELDGGDIPANTPVEFIAADGDFAFFDNAGEGNFSVISEFAEGDTINVDAAADTYSFTSEGTDLLISTSSNGVSTSIRIEDVVELDEFVEDEASAEAAVGFDFFQSSVAPPPPPPPGEASLDVGGASAVTIDAGSSAFEFTETGGVASNVVVTNFSDDDSIVVTDLNSDQEYSFTSVDLDGDGMANLNISFSNGSVSSNIVLEDAISVDSFVEDEASAEAALGADFFSYA